MLDQELLERYRDERSDAAFAGLVDRYASLVYNAANRQVRDPGTAEDVAQAVFILLAQKAEKLSPDIALSGWLLKTTHYCARAAMRAAQRRGFYEQKAATMRPEAPLAAGESTWARLEPHLDAVLARLPAKDRVVLTLKYLEDRTFEQVSVQIGASPAATQKRATRALDRLRRMLGGRGLMFSTAGLVGVLAARPSKALPPHLLSAFYGTCHVSRSATVPSALIAKGATSLMLSSNIKTALLVAAQLLALLVPAVLVYRFMTTDRAAGPRVALVQRPTPTIEPLASTSPTVTAPAAPAPPPAAAAVAAAPATGTALAPTMDLVVVDENTQEPIAGLDVLTAGIQPRFRGVTGADGHVRVPVPKTDKFNYFNLAVRGPGYVFKHLFWSPQSPTLGGRPAASQTIEMEHSTTIRGRIVDTQGAPVPRATVMLVFEKDYADPHEMIDIGGDQNFTLIKTDAAGRFTFNGAPLECKAINVGAIEAHHVTLPMQPYTPMSSLRDGSATLALEPGVSVAGTVTDEQGNPVANAFASIEAPTAANMPPTLKTAADGKFAFGFHPGDRTSLRFYAKGFGMAKQEVVVGTEDQQLTVQLPRSR